LRPEFKCISENQSSRPVAAHPQAARPCPLTVRKTAAARTTSLFLPETDPYSFSLSPCGGVLDSCSFANLSQSRAMSIRVARASSRDKVRRDLRDTHVLFRASWNWPGLSLGHEDNPTAGHSFTIGSNIPGRARASARIPEFACEFEDLHRCRNVRAGTSLQMSPPGGRPS